MPQRHLGPVNTEAIHQQEEAERKAREDAWLLYSLGPKNYRIQKAEDAKLEAFFAKHDAERRPLSAAAQAALDKARAKIRADVKPFLTDELILLGVNREASKREVKNAYRRKARKLHPDVGGDEAAFKQLHEAYRKVLAAAKN